MKRIKLHPNVVEAFEERRHAFKAKFGRKPRPKEPIFFDPDADEPRFLNQDQIGQIQRQICEVMSLAGIDPAVIYAYQKTGRILTDSNMKYLSREDLEEWSKAIEEYNSKKTHVN